MSVGGTSPTAERVLGVFAKAPVPGRAKTRLAETAGDAWAARVAAAFLADTLERLAAAGARRFVAFDPPDARPFFASLVAGRYELAAQAPGHLGERLSAFVRDRQREGAAAIVLVGTDSPTLPAEFVRRAFEELERADLVLGPATDGGYYLVGCGRRLPPIFEGIDWGGPRVLAETVARLGEPGWRLAVLPPWYDVDTAQDWEMLCGHLAALRRAGTDPSVPHTERLLTGLSSCSSPLT